MTYSNRGVAYYFKGDYARAIESYDEAIRRDPSNARAYGNRGAALKRIGQGDRALTDENEAIRLDPDHPRKLRQPWTVV